MIIMRTRGCYGWILAFALLCGGVGRPTVLHAASPWYVDPKGTGTPYTWGSGSLPWFIEQQDLGPIKYDQVLDIIKTAFATWQQAALPLSSKTKVATVKMTPVMGGIIKEPVTEKNYDQLSKTVIVMDPDGKITMQEMCRQDPVGCKNDPTIFKTDAADVAALTLILDLDDASLTVKRGVTVLNGLFLAGADAANDKDPKMQQFRSTVTHEIGHLFNLDHSALNQEVYSGEVEGFPIAGAIPTMYPLILEGSNAQQDLHEDDIVAISDLYPAPDYTQKFCLIAGKLIGSDQKGLQGALVVARSTLDPTTVAVSTLSGGLFPAETADGSYFLRGIKPGLKYSVGYGELADAKYTGSGLGPYFPPRGGFGQGPILAGGGKLKEVSCAKGGETIVMDTVQLSVAFGGDPATNSKIKLPAGLTPDTSAESGGGGCSLRIPRR